MKKQLIGAGIAFVLLFSVTGCASHPTPSDETAGDEWLSFDDVVIYEQTQGQDADHCLMPENSSVTALPKPTAFKFYPEDPSLTFTMEIPYSEEWIFGKKRLMPAQTMYDDHTYYFGKASMRIFVDQDIYCGFDREFNVSAEIGKLSDIEKDSSLKIGGLDAAIASDSGIEELVVQAGDLLVRLYPVNDQTKSIAETIKR